MIVIVLSLIFLCVSFFFSMLGMGGGMFYVPILLFAGTPIHNAAAVSLSLILVMSLSALFVFLKNRVVDWKLAAVIDPPTDIMAFVGGYFSAFLPEPILKIVLASVLIVSGICMVKKIVGNRPIDNRKRWWHWDRNFNGVKYRVNLLLTLPITAGIGMLAGMIGITGGVIKLPLMVLLCGVPMDIAIATSTVMVAVTAISGLAGHFMRGHIDFSMFIPFAAAAIIGGQIGSRVSVKSDKSKLRKVFGFALIFMALKILVELI